MRYIHETHIMKNALLPIIYHPCTVRSSDLTRIANWHENVEFLCFYRGEGMIRFETEWKSVKCGDIAVINPDVLHHIASGSEVEYHCLIVDRKFCEDNGIDILSLKFNEIIRDERLFSAFEKMIELIKPVYENDIDEFSVAKARHSLLGFLLDLCIGHITEKAEKKNSRPGASERVKTVMLYLRARISEPVTLDEIAEHVGISKYHLSREFKLYAGSTLFDYLNIIRCKEAQRMLTDGATVSEAATACGFESLSYFTRSFKKYIGKLPSSYKRL